MPIFLTSLLFLLISCAQIEKNTQPILHKKILDNGLTVILLENHHLPIFSYYTFYKVGSKFEPQGMTGSSHYLEHLMFKGAKKYGMGEFDRLIEEYGGKNNAYTNYDLTVYYEDITLPALKAIIDLEADRMQNLLLDPEGLEKERQVVLEERKMRYENSPQGQLSYALMENMFKGTPYQHSVIGEIVDIKTVSREQIYHYFKKFYAPNNAVIVAVGDFQAQEILKEIEAKYGSIPADEKLVDLKKENKKSHYQSRLSASLVKNLKGPSPAPLFRLSYSGFPYGTAESYFLEILGSYLADGSSSYLKQKYIESKQPILTSVFAYHQALEHAGVFVLGGQLAPQIKPEDLRKELTENLKKACDEISENSLQKVKNNYLVAHYQSIQTNNALAHMMGLGEVFLGDPLHYQKEMDIYQQMSLLDVQNICYKVISGHSLFISLWEKNK
ncbi:MAG: insulinase family protein [Bacteriovoracaceae bacterium]|nr:insulinase family protein [Bacteriovoracaceae bacterium]